MDRKVLAASDKVWTVRIPASTVQSPGIMIFKSFRNLSKKARFTVGFLFSLFLFVSVVVEIDLYNLKQFR